MRTANLIRHVLLTSALIVWLSGTRPAQAQQGTLPWSLPENISKSGIAFLPQIATDFEGRVHVVWSEPSTGGPDATPDAVMYAKLEDGVWSQPIDILSSGVGNLSYPVDLQVDPYGDLALVWRSNDTLHLSKATPKNAGSAPEWQTLVVDPTSVNSASLAFDELGTYYLAYVRDNQDLVLSTSTDGGSSWLNPTSIAVAESDNESFIDPSLALVGEEAFLTWTRNLKEESWGPAGVWFSRSEDVGSTWVPSQELVPGSGYGWSHLLADARGRMHFSWIGNLEAGGRFYRWSDDGGITWSQTEFIATPEQLRGFAGRATLLLDSTGSLHTIFGGLGLGRPDSIWHSWKEGQLQGWTPPLAISSNSPDSQGAVAALSRGHIVHVVWLEYGTLDIWYSAYDTGAPEIVQAPLPIPTVGFLAITTTETPQKASNSPTSEPTPLGTPFSGGSASSQPMSDSSVLAIGIAAPMILVLAVVSSVLLRQRRIRGR